MVLPVKNILKSLQLIKIGTNIEADALIHRASIDLTKGSWKNKNVIIMSRSKIEKINYEWKK